MTTLSTIAEANEGVENSNTPERTVEGAKDDDNNKEKDWDHISETRSDDLVRDHLKEDVPPGYPYRSWKDKCKLALEFFRGLPGLHERTGENRRDVRGTV
ncbi:hypothetical protein MMC14_007204 [Varicellaria rhodocarpa]|nr:hypothetical protein [Varicellaria rhodocarpa]